MSGVPHGPTLFPYTTLFRSRPLPLGKEDASGVRHGELSDPELRARQDRKSTRLNSSHVETSYAGFCHKKKTACGRALAHLHHQLVTGHARPLEVSDDQVAAV